MRPPAVSGSLIPEIDPRTLPIEPILRQAVDDDLNRAGEAWKFLGVMAAHDRTEAGVFLLGLMRVHGADLARMTVLIEAVSYLRSPAAAEALKGEFYRVSSSPATRTYLNEVLRALMRLPADLAFEALGSLADDKSLSVRWRRRFEEAAWRLGRA